MSQPTTRPPRATGPSDPRIRRSWAILAGAFILLGLTSVARVVVPAPGPLEWLSLVFVAVAGAAAIFHARAVGSLEARRGAEAESFARILSGLSRSVSADAIVEAIVEELGDATGADHIVVVRRRPTARVLEARLVSSRPEVSDSTTLLPIADLEDPLRPSDRVENRIARRVRDVYGLNHSLAAPLTTESGVIGAIVLARRAGSGWPESTARILTGAAIEASAALSRAYSHHEAEARASTDALTGLPNRRYFDEYVQLAAERRRSGDSVGILMVDIDRFKALNDTHGHATGDHVLRAVGGAIVSAVRADDVPARFGGEEFIVLLRNPDPRVAIEVGERIRSAVGSLDLRRLGVQAVSVSVGVAVADERDEPIELLIETADRALYRAKRAGRDRVVAA